MNRSKAFVRGSRVRRIALGLSLAPAAPLLPLVLISGNDLIFPAVLLFAAIGYPVAMVVGLPVHLFLAHLHLSGIGVYLLAGNAIGSFVGAGFCLLTSFAEWPGVVLLCAGYGAVAMTTFRFIAVRETPARVTSNRIDDPVDRP